MIVVDQTPESDAQALIERWTVELGHGSNLPGVPCIMVSPEVMVHMREDLATLLHDTIRRTRGDYSA